jgi:hypothetical protein
VGLLLLALQLEAARLALPLFQRRRLGRDGRRICGGLHVEQAQEVVLGLALDEVEVSSRRA